MTKKPHPSARRKRGHKDEPEDAFLAWILESWHWAQEHSQALILGAVVLAVVIAGSVYYVNFRSSLEVRATGELESIQQALGTGQEEVARSQLEEFLDRFGDTDVAAEGRLLLGELHLRNGNPSQALEALAPVTRSLGRPIAIQAAILKAQAHEELGELEEAEETYLEVANESDLSFQINNALLAAARIRERTGDLAGAADLYRELLDTLDDDDEGNRGILELRLAEIRAAMDGA